VASGSLEGSLAALLLPTQISSEGVFLKNEEKPEYAYLFFNVYGCSANVVSQEKV